MYVVLGNLELDNFIDEYALHAFFLRKTSLCNSQQCFWSQKCGVGSMTLPLDLSMLFLHCHHFFRSNRRLLSLSLTPWLTWCNVTLVYMVYQTEPVSLWDCGYQYVSQIQTCLCTTVWYCGYFVSQIWNPKWCALSSKWMLLLKRAVFCKAVLIQSFASGCIGCRWCLRWLFFCLWCTLWRVISWSVSRTGWWSCKLFLVCGGPMV